MPCTLTYTQNTPAELGRRYKMKSYFSMQWKSKAIAHFCDFLQDTARKLEKKNWLIFLVSIHPHPCHLQQQMAGNSFNAVIQS